MKDILAIVEGDEESKFMKYLGVIIVFCILTYFTILK